MSEATVGKTVDTVEIVEAEKPYHFRNLGAEDIFLMVKIVNKIGYQRLKGCFSGKNIAGIIDSFTSENDDGKDGGKDGGKAEALLATVGVGVVMDVVGVLLENLPACENDIYHMLANTSNLDVDDIKAPGNGVMFFEMIVDFLKKEEFKDFIKVASKLFK